ncbi:AAA family ATPase [Actinomyces viscosus]|uniref:AAA family ATPase n=1 Tax=Actinomyces viscosus TaxID=1656 RepID=UPI0028E918D7|nr:AAA family ATPase [Actinomyces viscosus]
MRTPLDSPFSPGSDTVPQVWAGRIEHLSDWRDIVRPRRIAGIHERGRTILGEAGSGKSSLVRRIAHEASEAGDWVTPQLRIPSGSDPMKRVSSALLELAATAGLPSAREQRIGSLLRRVETVAASGISLSVRAQDGPEPYTALTDLLTEIGRAAMAQDVMVMIHIDEVQNITNEHTRSQLLIALGDVLTHEEPTTVPGGLRIDSALPVAVYLTGLPEFADMAGARTGATFARRFQTTTLEAIDDNDLQVALHPFVTRGWPVTNTDGGTDQVFMEPDAQQAIIELSCGEPFLFQLAGQCAWHAGTDDVITAEHVRTGWHRQAAGEAEAHVQRILDRLPQRERELIEAMADLEPEERSLTNIAERLGYKRSTDAGPTAQRLDITRRIIRRGRPYRFQHRAVEAYLTSNWPR